MNKIKYLIFVTVFSTFLIGCGNTSEKNNTIKMNETIPVSVTTVKKGDITIQKTYGGTLEGIQQADIIAKISERITAINAVVGQQVEKGKVIIELEKTGPTSQYMQAKANFENLKKNYERMKALLQQGAVSQQSVDQAETSYEVAKANYEAASSAVNLAAPISGTITALNYNVGDWVNPGTGLATVANIGSMIIKFNAGETDVQDLKLGKTVYVYSDFQKDLKLKGHITEISRSASLDSRSFLVKAQFTNTRNDFFKPGMFVKANVVLESKQNVITIPTSSVIYNDKGATVYVIKNGMTFPENIEIGLANDSVTVVKNGLREGEVLVTAGMNNLSDSSKVSIVK